MGYFCLSLTFQIRLVNLVHHHAGRKTCVSPSTTFQGFPPNFHQGLPCCEEFHHEESMAFNTQQGKDNIFILSVCMLLGPFFFFFFDKAWIYPYFIISD